jgi:membrane-associated phospholipid phosphatase
MIRILVVAIWWAGLAVIFGTALLLVRRPRPRPARTDPGPAGPGAGRGQQIRLVARFLLLAIAGSALVYGIMAVVGLLAVHGGPVIDKPFFHWLMTHRVHLWKSAMTRATKIGDTWTVRGAAVAAAVCLAVSWRRLRWLPPVALAMLAVVHRGLIKAIHLTDPRVGPPGHLHGTFPSGGSERAIVFYGLIAYLLWREFSGRRHTAIWAGAVVAALGFSEGYSRLYLGMHWLTDVLSGWLCGAALLVVFISAVQLIAGPVRPRGRADTEVPLPAGSPSATVAGKVP